NGKGDMERAVLTLPDKGEYEVAVWDSLYNLTGNYTIARLAGRPELYQPPRKLRLVHDQFAVGTIQASLEFSFNGNKGDQVLFKGSSSLLSPADSLTTNRTMLFFDAYVNRNESLAFIYSEETGSVPTEIWEIEILEDNAGFILGIDLPKTGNYSMVINNTQPNEDDIFTLGFFKYDIYGQYKEVSTGVLRDSTWYLGMSVSKEIPFDSWTFTNTNNKELTLFVAPMDDADLAFNVINSKAESVVPLDRTTLANIIHALYIVLFGYIIVIGYRGLLRKSEDIQKPEGEPGKKGGNIVAIAGLVIFLLVILFFL
ncbi:MAG: hypothetical protein KJO90_07950, partial [Eudoraea sp.]|nr:hypothetical protein [Eudoraea sp.]